jgi:hypothetical protein
MAVPISNVTRRQVYAPSGAGGAGPYAFTFEILANTDIAVYKDDVLLTLTTHYTVTINANGTGSVTITAAGLALAPASPTQYAIVGNRTISRTTDFTTGGDFFANVLNDELDQQTIFNQQNAEGLQRALAAPQTDPTSINMTLPRAALRANKALGFDANGNPAISDTLGTNRGNWSAGVLYYARDIVKDTTNNNIWQCLVQHTSSGSQPINTNADSAKWSLLVDAASATSSASAAASSASAASASASNASTSASNASTSASNASTSASNAASSASAASTSASNAAASYDSFDDRYLGSKSSAPSVDNDGNSLLTGALYWDTALNQIRVWSGTAWVNVNASASNTRTAITATAGQTVLTVATYTPGTNTMVVYVNGVKLNASEYTETSATTVTVTTGLALNDEVEVFSYRVNEIGTLGASSVTIADTGNYYTGGNVETALQEAAIFTQAGTGAVARTTQSKMRDVVSVKDFGAAGDGVADDTAAFFAALVAANGRNVIVPAGYIYRITQSLSNSGASKINLLGETPALLSHPIINAAQLNNDPLYRVTGTGTPGSSTAVSAAAENAYMLATIPGVAIIKCDGCNLIGAPDTGTMNGDTDKLRSLKNLVLWGVNGAKHGVYSWAPLDQIIENNTFVLFEHFGLLHRGGITTNMHKNAFVDCGWNLANSGTITYSNTYSSGCAIKVCANNTAGDYTTINSLYRPTSFHSTEHVIWQRGYTANNKSGLRGVQAHGLLSGSIKCATQYTGDFFDISQIDVSGYHYENYHTGGVVANNLVPMNIYAINSQVDIGLGYTALVGAGITAGSPVWVITGTGVSFLPEYCSTDRSLGFTKSIGPAYSDMQKGVVVGPGGTTQTYTFKNVLSTGNGGGSKGFLGMVAVQLTSNNNFNNFSRGIWAVAAHRGSVDKVMTPVQIAYESSIAGIYGATVTATFSGNDLVVSVVFGSAWGPSEYWDLSAGMFGMPTISV